VRRRTWNLQVSERLLRVGSSYHGEYPRGWERNGLQQSDRTVIFDSYISGRIQEKYRVDICVAEGEAVAWPRSVPFKFTGKISKVTIEMKPRAAAIAIEADGLSVKSAVKRCWRTGRIRRGWSFTRL